MKPSAEEVVEFRWDGTNTGELLTFLEGQPPNISQFWLAYMEKHREGVTVWRKDGDISTFDPANSTARPRNRWDVGNPELGE